MAKSNNEPGFHSCENKGFQITFQNGWTISVQFGVGNYCARKDYSAPFGAERRERLVHSPNAEIAIWNKDNHWISFGNDTVLGNVTPDEVALWIAEITQWGEGVPKGLTGVDMSVEAIRARSEAAQKEWNDYQASIVIEEMEKDREDISN
jgi:hypothetical protein